MSNSPVTGETMEKRLRELAERLISGLAGLHGSLREISDEEELGFVLKFIQKSRDIALEEAAKIADRWTYLDGQAGQLASVILKSIRSLKTPGGH